MRSWTPVDQYVYGVSLAVASRYSRYKIRYKIRLKSVTKLKIFFACGGLKRWFFTFRIEMLDCSGARPGKTLRGVSLGAPRCNTLCRVSLEFRI